MYKFAHIFVKMDRFTSRRPNWSAEHSTPVEMIVFVMFVSERAACRNGHLAARTHLFWFQRDVMLCSGWQIHISSVSLSSVLCRGST